jgi:hypothetical protein
MAHGSDSDTKFKLLTEPDLRTTPALDARFRYSIVIENDTSETIVAYVLRVELVDADGVTGIEQRIYSNFDFTTLNGNEIAPWSARVITPSFGVSA